VQVELIMDEKLYEQISGQLMNGLGKVLWSKVTMPLSTLLQGDFFNTYIKRGNISMLSEGRPGLDPLYTLHEGVLRLELPKELYERCGLVGHAIPDGGRKHIKSRFAVEVNLRQASMVHGKKGFERIVWAFKNVLSEPVKWLFHDHWTSQTLESGSIPLSLHEPANKEAEPVVARLKDVQVPDMRSWSEEPERDNDDAIALLDWLGMVAMDSPRISASDSIDPFLARYEVPGRESAATSNLVKVCWHGFVQSQWIRQLLHKCM
jgi:ribonuclease P/MRP protein subunit RPP40